MSSKLLNWVGIDPSKRHTGLCLLNETVPRFNEIRTNDVDVLTAAGMVHTGVQHFLAGLDPACTTVCPERQLSVGGQSSSILFSIQLKVLEAIQNWDPNHKCQFVFPLPTQLNSYRIHQHGFVNKESDSAQVARFKATTGFQGRLSIHCVDAYYLSLLAKDVLQGIWKYKIPANEPPITPWIIQNGERC